MNLDPEKLLVLLVIALLVLGPQRLPQVARSLGRGLAEFRKYTSGLQTELREVLAEPRAIIDTAVHEAAEAAPASPLAPDPAPVASAEPGPGPAPPAPDDPTLN